MLAAEEMGTKGVRAMTPLETTLANALRVKLGKGRDLPEEPKPKRPARAKTAAPAEGDAEGELKKVAHPRKKATGEDEAAPVEARPAAAAPPGEAPPPPAGGGAGPAGGGGGGCPAGDPPAPRPDSRAHGRVARGRDDRGAAGRCQARARQGRRVSDRRRAGREDAPEVR